jgi:hypothetical protein
MKRLALVLCALTACGDNLASYPDAAGDDLGDGSDVTDGDDVGDGTDVGDGDIVIFDAAIDAPPLPGDGAITLACTIEDLTPLFTCAVTECADDLSLTCVLASCALLLFALPPDCQACILAGFTSGDLTACVGGLPMP